MTTRCTSDSESSDLPVARLDRAAGCCRISLLSQQLQEVKAALEANKGSGSGGAAEATDAKPNDSAAAVSNGPASAAASPSKSTAASTDGDASSKPAEAPAAATDGPASATAEVCFALCSTPPLSFRVSQQTS